MKKILTILFISLSRILFGQHVSDTYMDGYLNTNIVPNASNAITAAKMNLMLNYLVDSKLNKDSALVINVVDTSGDYSITTENQVIIFNDLTGGNDTLFLGAASSHPDQVIFATSIDDSDTVVCYGTARIYNGSSYSTSFYLTDSTSSVIFASDGTYWYVIGKNSTGGGGGGSGTNYWTQTGDTIIPNDLDYVDIPYLTADRMYSRGGDGDYNESGDVNVTDALAIELYLRGTLSPTKLQLMNMDIDGDGIITKIDADVIRAEALVSALVDPAVSEENYDSLKRYLGANKSGFDPLLDFRVRNELRIDTLQLGLKDKILVSHNGTLSSTDEHYVRYIPIDSISKLIVDSIESIISSAGDNLGDHTATENIVLGNNYISNNGTSFKGLGFAANNQLKVTELPFSTYDQPQYQVVYNDDSLLYKAKDRVNFVGFSFTGMPIFNFKLYEPTADSSYVAYLNIDRQFYQGGTGDVDGDYSVAVTDILLIRNYLEGKITKEDLEYHDADINGNGFIDISDSWMASGINIGTYYSPFAGYLDTTRYDSLKRYIGLLTPGLDEIGNFKFPTSISINPDDIELTPKSIIATYIDDGYGYYNMGYIPWDSISNNISFTEVDGVIGNEGDTTSHLVAGWGLSGAFYNQTSDQTWEIDSNNLTLNILDDVTLNAPDQGDLLMLNETNQWVNWTPTYISSYSETDPIYADDSTDIVMWPDTNALNGVGIATYDDLRNLSVGGDNLGNHTATEDLIMEGYDIYRPDSIREVSWLDASYGQINNDFLVGNDFEVTHESTFGGNITMITNYISKSGNTRKGIGFTNKDELKIGSISEWDISQQPEYLITWKPTDSVLYKTPYNINAGLKETSVPSNPERVLEFVSYDTATNQFDDAYLYIYRQYYEGGTGDINGDYALSSADAGEIQAYFNYGKDVSPMDDPYNADVDLDGMVTMSDRDIILAMSVNGAYPKIMTGYEIDTIAKDSVRRMVGRFHSGLDGEVGFRVRAKEGLRIDSLERGNHFYIMTADSSTNGYWQTNYIPYDSIISNIPTGAVADGATTLTTGDQVRDYVVGLGYITSSLAADLDVNAYDIDQVDSLDVEELEIVNTAGYTDIPTNTITANATTIDWRLSNVQQLTYSDTCTFTFTAPQLPCHLTLKMTHANNTTVFPCTWPAAVKWPGGTAITPTAAANAVDVVSFFYDGTNYYGMYGNDFK